MTKLDYLMRVLQQEEWRQHHRAAMEATIGDHKAYARLAAERNPHEFTYQEIMGMDKEVHKAVDIVRLLLK